jgi:hypothetical protein
MSSPDLDDVLGMRLAGAQARMADLQRLLPYAAGDEDRRTGLANRISGRTGWITQLSGDDAWTRWDTGDPTAELLVDEVVALALTRLLRDSGVDAGVFDSAEAFLAELVGAAGIPGVVLGQTQEFESVDHTRASVALRFPGSRVWDLPFLAHELGHHAVRQLPHVEPALRDNRPLAQVVTAVHATLLDLDQPDGRADAHANELVADALATICCGPTYPVACLCLRVPVGGRGTRASETHPSWADRVAAMCSVLDELSDTTGLARYRQQRSNLVDPLAEAVLARRPVASAAVAQAAQRTVSTVSRHRPGLVYRDADRGIDVAEHLTRRAAGPPEDATVASVLDGAWRWRLAGARPPDEDEAAGLVANYCRQISLGGDR